MWTENVAPRARPSNHVVPLFLPHRSRTNLSGDSSVTISITSAPSLTPLHRMKIALASSRLSLLVKRRKTITRRSTSSPGLAPRQCLVPCVHRSEHFQFLYFSARSRGHTTAGSVSQGDGVCCMLFTERHSETIQKTKPYLTWLDATIHPPSWRRQDKPGKDHP